MNSEVFEALSLLEKERGIPVDFMVDKHQKGHCDRVQKQLRQRGRRHQYEPGDRRVRGVSAQDGCVEDV